MCVVEMCVVERTEIISMPDVLATYRDTMRRRSNQARREQKRHRDSSGGHQKLPEQMDIGLDETPPSVLSENTRKT